MITYENECINCFRELGCLGNGCPYRNVPHYFCDSCNKEIKEKDIYKLEDEELCIECFIKLTDLEEEQE